MAAAVYKVCEYEEIAQSLSICEKQKFPETVVLSHEAFSYIDTKGRKFMSGNVQIESTDEKWYSVSEAVEATGVPSHVLRYWEDELGVPIKRNAQGHRIYSEKNVQTFRWAKALKEKGIQLRAIRVLLEEGADSVNAAKKERLRSLLDADDRKSAENGEPGTEEEIPKGSQAVRQTWDDPAWEPGDAAAQHETPEAEYEIITTAKADNLGRFEMILRRLMEEVVAEQNEKLKQEFSGLIREEIEELYLQLEQEIRREAAASCEAGKKEKGLWQRLKRMLGR